MNFLLASAANVFKSQRDFFESAAAFTALILKKEEREKEGRKVSSVLKSGCDHTAWRTLEIFNEPKKPWLGKTITGFPFDINGENLPDCEKKKLSLSLSLSLFSSRVRSRRVSSSTLLHDVTRGTWYRFRITLADRWRNLIGGRGNSQFNSEPASKRSTCREKNYLTRMRSQKSRGPSALRIRAVKITRGRNLSIKPIAACKDHSPVTYCTTVTQPISLHFYFERWFLINSATSPFDEPRERRRKRRRTETRDSRKLSSIFVNRPKGNARATLGTSVFSNATAKHSVIKFNPPRIKYMLN